MYGSPAAFPCASWSRLGCRCQGCRGVGLVPPASHDLSVSVHHAVEAQAPHLKSQLAKKQYPPEMLDLIQRKVDSINEAITNFRSKISEAWLACAVSDTAAVTIAHRHRHPPPCLPTRLVPLGWSSAAAVAVALCGRGIAVELNLVLAPARPQAGPCTPSAGIMPLLTCARTLQLTRLYRCCCTTAAIADAQVPL